MWLVAVWGGQGLLCEERMVTVFRAGASPHRVWGDDHKGQFAVSVSLSVRFLAMDSAVFHPVTVDFVG